MSFWNKKDDAERYRQEQYPKIHEMLKHLLEVEPVIRTFDVNSSTTHGSQPATPPETQLMSLEGELQSSPFLVVVTYCPA